MRWFGSPSNETLKNGLGKGTERPEFNIDPTFSLLPYLYDEKTRYRHLGLSQCSDGMAEQLRIGALRRLAATPHAGTRSTLAVCQAQRSAVAMRETPGINPFRNGPTLGEGRTHGCFEMDLGVHSDPLFAEQIPARDCRRV